MVVRALSLEGSLKCLLLALVQIGASAIAQSTLPNPTLLSIYPPAAKSGSVVTVTVTGSSLEGLLRLHFPVPGVTSKPGAKPNELQMTLGEEVKPGFYDVRVVTRYGISNPRGFYICREPLVELKSGSKLEHGQIGYGQAIKADRMKVSVDTKAAQALRVAVQASALDSRMEPRVSVRDVNKIIMGRAFEGRSYSFTPKVAGNYTLEIQDLMFRGDVEHPFVVSLNGGLDKPRLLKSQEPPDSVKAQPLAIQGSYTGVFPADSMSRIFTFKMKKGEVRVIDVRSARVGELADPFFIVEKVKDGNAVFIAEVNDRKVIAAKEEFDDGAADPVYRLESAEDADYRIQLRNNLPNQAQFELSVRPPGGSFELVALPAEIPAAKKTATAVGHLPLWRGSIAALKVYALRDVDFVAPISLTVEGLPPGVTAGAAIIDAGANIGWLTLSAAKDAAPWAGSIKIKGNNKVLARAAVTIRATANTAREPIYTRLADDLVIAVSEAQGPILVEPEKPIIEAGAAEKVTVPFKVARLAGFDAEVKLTALGIGDKTPPVLTCAAKAASSELMLDLAKLKLSPGDHTVVLQGAVKFSHLSVIDVKAKPKEVSAVVHSKSLTLRIK